MSKSSPQVSQEKKLYVRAAPRTFLTSYYFWHHETQFEIRLRGYPMSIGDLVTYFEISKLFWYQIPANWYLQHEARAKRTFSWQVENYFYSVRKNVFEYDDVGHSKFGSFHLDDICWSFPSCRTILRWLKLRDWAIRWWTHSARSCTACDVALCWTLMKTSGAKGWVVWWIKCWL